MQTRKAIEHFGSTRKLAEALGITPQAINQWGNVVPMLRQYELERVTDGKLKADIAKHSANATPTASAPQP
tara:strand:- start:383 stop:595 length:213 start_codon:yes stop_codon:yes gene_type:complete